MKVKNHGFEGWQRALFFLVLFALMAMFVLALPKAKADSFIRVVSGEQPSATLAVERSIVEFTNFTVRPGGKEILLSEVIVERTGLSNADAIDEVMLVVKDSPGVDSWEDGCVIATGVFDQSGKVRLKNSYNSNGRLRSFTKAANFAIAAVMKSDLANYSGQVVYLTVKKIKITDVCGKKLKVKGKLPITGAGHTVNHSLEIGSLTINSEYKIGHEYAQFNFTAGSIESVLIEKIFIRIANEFPEDANLYFSLSSGEEFKFFRDGNWMILDFKENFEISKSEAITAQIYTYSKNGLPEIEMRPEDVIVRGKTYEYQIYPELNMEVTE